MKTAAAGIAAVLMSGMTGAWLLAGAKTAAAQTETKTVKTIEPPGNAGEFYPARATRWEKEVAALEARDRPGPDAAPAPLTGGILFVGSSSIVKWSTLAKDFPDLPVLNRGFGGSQIRDVTYFADRVALPYKPHTIILYGGDNDIAAGRETGQVLGDFQSFAQRIRGALPETRIIFLAIKPSPARWHLEDRMVAANRAVADWIKTQENMTFVDVHTPMLGADGRTRPELYVSDKLHMAAPGYQIWRQVLAPYLYAPPSTNGPPKKK